MKSSDGRFEYRDNNDEPVAPGTPAEQVHRFAFVCRASKKGDANTPNMCSVNLAGRGHDIQNRNWHWDGNFDTPTLFPSIDCKACWHGYIEQGIHLTASKMPESMQ